MRQAHRARQAHPVRTTATVLVDSLVSSITRWASRSMHHATHFEVPKHLYSHTPMEIENDTGS
jgi:hypothetical protein